MHYYYYYYYTIIIVVVIATHDSPTQRLHLFSQMFYHNLTDYLTILTYPGSLIAIRVRHDIIGKCTHDGIDDQGEEALVHCGQQDVGAHFTREGVIMYLKPKGYDFQPRILAAYKQCVQ